MTQTATWVRWWAQPTMLQPTLSICAAPDAETQPTCPCNMAVSASVQTLMATVHSMSKWMTPNATRSTNHAFPIPTIAAVLGAKPSTKSTTEPSLYMMVTGGG